MALLTITARCFSLQAFLIPEFVQKNPDDAGNVERLKDLIVEQVKTIKTGQAPAHSRVNFVICACKL